MFQELAIINGTKRNSTVICKETCEFLSISVKVGLRRSLSKENKNLHEKKRKKRFP